MLCAKHNFSPATCTTAATYTKCGETNGSALGHDFSEATCTEAGILEDDKITFYGTYGGLYTYTTVLGDSLTIPSIYVEYLGKPQLYSIEKPLFLMFLML